VTFCASSCASGCHLGLMRCGQWQGVEHPRRTDTDGEMWMALPKETRPMAAAARLSLGLQGTSRRHLH
jgi:hypothetical protein